MDTNRFFEVRAELEDLARNVLDQKGIAYAQEAVSQDRLANFKRSAKFYGVSPFQVLGIFMAKHLDSLQTWIREASEGGPIPAMVGGETVEGRIVDIRNYLDLLYAMYREATQEEARMMLGDVIHADAARSDVYPSKGRMS